ncbi:hypothetical protein LMG1860_04800 [Achromobacter denitrificans]|nr:hypothetical protein LMG1860_04800 [Achromobacter denitrificans]
MLCDSRRTENASTATVVHRLVMPGVGGLPSRRGADQAGQRATGSADGAGGALSGFAAVTDTHGGHVSRGRGGGREMVGRAHFRIRRPGRQGGRGRGLGPQRQIPGGLPLCHGHDGQAARLGEIRGRRLPRPARCGHGFGPAVARPGPEGRQPEEHAAAEGHVQHYQRQDGRRDRTGRPAGGLRAQLQPHRGLRRLGVPVLSSLLLSAAAGLGVRHVAGGRHRLRPGRRRRQLHVGRLRLGAWRRRYRRQPLQQHQRQPAHRPEQRQ